MAKPTRRVPRPTSPLISPALRDQLVLMPHVHLEMFFNGTAEIEQMKIVASFLNMGSVMAAFSGDGQRQAAFHRVLDIVAQHVQERTGEFVAAPAPHERKELELCFTWSAVKPLPLGGGYKARTASPSGWSTILRTVR